MKMYQTALMAAFGVSASLATTATDACNAHASDETKCTANTDPKCAYTKAGAGTCKTSADVKVEGCADAAACDKNNNEWTAGVCKDKALKKVEGCADATQCTAASTNVWTKPSCNKANTADGKKGADVTAADEAACTADAATNVWTKGSCADKAGGAFADGKTEALCKPANTNTWTAGSCTKPPATAGAARVKDDALTTSATCTKDNNKWTAGAAATCTTKADTTDTTGSSSNAYAAAPLVALALGFLVQ